jgi:CubicO group peptidase (beta-lactamase class C family)
MINDKKHWCELIHKFPELFLTILMVMSPAVQALDKWLTETTTRHHVAGLTAVIVQDGKTVFKKSYGLTDTSSDVDLTTKHYFHMASVSKPIVAVAVMQLMEAGKVDLDAPVTRYLPYFTMADDRLEGVTVGRLLSHTSGMPDVDDYEWNKPQYDEQALERWVKAQASRSLLFTPGEKNEYSNVGFEI